MERRGFLSRLLGGVGAALGIKALPKPEQRPLDVDDQWTTIKYTRATNQICDPPPGYYPNCRHLECLSRVPFSQRRGEWYDRVQDVLRNA